MATLNLAKLARMLECPVCLGTLENPRMMICGHTLCLECTERLVEVKKKKKSVKCPTCRQITRLEKNAHELPKPFVVNDVQETIHALMKEKSQQKQEEHASCPPSTDGGFLPANFMETVQPSFTSVDEALIQSEIRRKNAGFYQHDQPSFQPVGDIRSTPLPPTPQTPAKSTSAQIKQGSLEHHTRTRSRTAEQPGNYFVSPDMFENQLPYQISRTLKTWDFASLRDLANNSTDLMIIDLVRKEFQIRLESQNGNQVSANPVIKDRTSETRKLDGSPRSSQRHNQVPPVHLKHDTLLPMPNIKVNAITAEIIKLKKVEMVEKKPENMLIIPPGTNTSMGQEQPKYTVVNKGYDADRKKKLAPPPPVKPKPQNIAINDNAVSTVTNLERGKPLKPIPPEESTPSEPPPPPLPPRTSQPEEEPQLYQNTIVEADFQDPVIIAESELPPRLPERVKPVQGFKDGSRVVKPGISTPTISPRPGSKTIKSDSFLPPSNNRFSESPSFSPTVPVIGKKPEFSGAAEDQKYYRVPLYKTKPGEGKKIRGWWMAHFDGERVARQLQTHIEKPPKFGIAGIHDDDLFQERLEETGLKTKVGAEISFDVFDTEWNKNGGDVLLRALKDKIASPYLQNHSQSKVGLFSPSLSQHDEESEYSIF